ncbi:hypothetical protein HAX54_018469 [Datura stramonium]|uniref:Uncharacterized protein n=1 Tax=Datura stramonium TaxID=4076 RepID=A0ABS8UNL3_DATST|nr:hypothetical protein [Datura stramonium]
MAQNDIDDVLDHLRRIKTGGDLNILKINRIQTLEVVLGFFRTFIKYYDVLLPDCLVKLTTNAKLSVKLLHRVFDGIPDECKNVERLVSQLLKFIECIPSVRYNYELNYSDLSEYMDCLGKNLNDVRMCLELDGSTDEKNLELNRFIKQLKIIQKKMRFLRYLYATEINSYVDHEKLECLETRIEFMANNVGQYCLDFSLKLTEFDVGKDEDEDEKDEDEYDILNKPPYMLCLIVLVELEMKKIFLGELKASKFTQSRTFKDKKLPKGFSHHFHSLLVYLRNKKLEYLRCSCLRTANPTAFLS